MISDTTLSVSTSQIIFLFYVVSSLTEVVQSRPASLDGERRSLVVWYSSECSDNWVSGTNASNMAAQAAGYWVDGQKDKPVTKAAPDGMAFDASTVPPEQSLTLQAYWSNILQDTLLVASEQGEKWASNKTYNYTKLRVEGYCMGSKIPGIPTQTMLQYYSESRRDTFLCAQGSSHEQSAKSAGYKLMWAECYLPVGSGKWEEWPNASNPPPGAPWPKSKDIIGWELLSGANANYGGADTWYPSWAADGNLYTPWTDGCVVDSVTHVKVCASSGAREKATTGYATVIGDSPYNLTITNVSKFQSSTLPYQGRYPCGSLAYGGVWYYGTYYLENPTIPPNPPPNCGNWCVQGPFVGYRYSTDKGNTWTEPRLNATGPSDNIFGENAMNNGKVKFGAPHVVDFGQEMKHSPDGKMYIVGHGAQRPEAHESWMQGDSVYMARVHPTIKSINDAAQWEFYAGGHGSDSHWVKGDISAAKPLFTWNNHTGVVTMTYVSALKKYLMVVSTPTYTPYTTKEFDTYFLESDTLTGPWAFVNWLKKFGPEAYFVHIPTKFLSAQNKGRLSRRFS